MKNIDIISSDKVVKKDPAKAIQVGLSACLAGQTVRYNGGHTQSHLCLNVLSEHFNFKTFCPEVAAGFGTPRPTMRLVGEPSAPQLVFTNDESTDLTEQLVDGFKDQLPEMGKLDGYILMKNSPSCGLERIKVYQTNGYPHVTKTAGIFAQALKNQYPLMPIEEEGRLHDPKLFDNFVARVYAYHNFKQEVLSQPSLHKLIDFHSSYKYLLMAHNQQHCKQLGKLLAGHRHQDINELISHYFTDFMAALEKPANKRNHSNALLHILGYLKTSVPSEARQHIAETIHKYRQGIFPLTTPLTLLKHYLNQYGSSYIKNQRYLDPYPENINPISKYYQ